MFPGMGKMNPKQMQNMLKQFGIKSEEVPAKRVIFELEDGRIIIEEPQVTAMHVQGQKTYTVMGTEKTESAGIPESDIEMVAEQAGVPKEKAKKALEETNGDIAEAILKLKKS
jgi:nascent polypeptide-associated complex subunit alpha